MGTFWTRKNKKDDKDERTASPWQEVSSFAGMRESNAEAATITDMVRLKDDRRKTDESATHYPHYDVVAAVVVYEGKVLCVKKGKTRYDYTSMHWEFPGGKVEEGEAPEEALHRELLEELELDVEVGQHLISVDHAYKDFSISMAAYLCHASGSEVQLKEHVEARWVQKNELMQMEWCAADVPIAEHYSEKT